MDTFDDDQNLDTWKPLLTSEEKIGTEASLISTFKPDVSYESETVIPDLPTTRIVMGEEILSGAEENLIQPGDDNETEQAGDTFEVIEEIGKGGMGVVYKALQSTIGREVALKVTSERDPTSLSLFLSEARVTGRLEHANIVPVHFLGRSPEGLPSLVLKLIKGISWRDLLRTFKGKDLEVKDHLKILLSVCNAVAYAHQHGILHRDLKPENVMVGEFGQVFVMDWGLAISFGSETDTSDGILSTLQVSHPAGTPGYMAPELALGLGAAQDQRTDVYLLGACLHEILTKRLRHMGAKLTDVLKAAVDSKPFDYDPLVPRELSEICNRATARDPEDRFENVQDFAKAIEDFLEHEQASILIRKAIHLGEQLKELTLQSSKALHDQRDELDLQINQLYSEARFAFNHALEIWPEARDGIEGFRTLNEVMMTHALNMEDLNLAMRLSEDVVDPGLIERLDELRERIAARERELEALREKARQHDWSAIARPLGTTLLLVGIFGGLGIVDSYLLRHVFTPYDSPVNRFLLWLPIIFGVGIVSIKQFRKVRFSGSLISMQTIGIWGAILIASVFIEGVNALLGLPNYHLLGAHSLLLGVGIASLAFQTRMWLLIPAAVFYPASLLMAAYPDAGREILGVLFFFVLGGIGLSFRLGFVLDPTSQDEML
jgi:serine/threonine protein kinase